MSQDLQSYGILYGVTLTCQQVADLPLASSRDVAIQMLAFGLDLARRNPVLARRVLDEMIQVDPEAFQRLSRLVESFEEIAQLIIDDTIPLAFKQ